MNLVKEPWVPVITQDGTKKLVSLFEAFERGDEWCDLAVNPIQRLSLMRLLICIAQAALDGPEDEQDWLNCRSRLVPAALGYLEKWHSAFELYGEHPFLQVNELKMTGNAVLDKLDFSLSAGNNSVLFDHQAHPDGRHHTDAWHALMLLTFQCFSPGGLIGVNQWGGQKTTTTSEHAPAVEGSALHSLIRRELLTESIHSNLVTKQQIATISTEYEWGRPIWETMYESDNCNLISSIPRNNYLERLVPLSRAIKLGADINSFTLANGLPYAKLPIGREVDATVVIRKKGKEEYLGYVAVNLHRHPWRELAAILTLGTHANSNGPMALAHLKQMEQHTVDIWTGGLAADKGKILDMAEWSFTLPVALLQESVLKEYETGVDMAVQGERALAMAVAKYGELLNLDKKVLSGVRGIYWGVLDNTYAKLIEAVDSSDGSINGIWYPEVRCAMELAYDRFCAKLNARQIKAYALGRKKLYLKKLEV